MAEPASFEPLWGDGMTRYGIVGATDPSAIVPGLYIGGNAVSSMSVAAGLRAELDANFPSRSLRMIGTTPQLTSALLYPETGETGGLPAVSVSRRLLIPAATVPQGMELFHLYYGGWLSILVSTNLDGSISVYRRDNSGLGGSFASTTEIFRTSNQLFASTAQSVQLYVIADSGSSGEVHIGIDGGVEESETGVRTLNGYTGGHRYDTLHWRGPIYTQDHVIGWGGLPPDLEVWEGRPYADVEVAFTPSTGSDNFAMVDDESAPDDGATKNTISVAGRDLLQFPDPGFGVGTSILGLIMSARLQKSAAGAATGRVILSHGGDDMNGETRSIPAEAWLWRSRAWATNAHTAAAFVPADLAAGAVAGGYERVA